MALLLVAPGAAQAVEKASENVSPFFGSFGYTIPIEAPAAFHGVEPRLALGYTSEGRNGFVGVGWTLAGVSSIERTGTTGGTPRFDGTDSYRLDGQELVACGQGSVSPSCTTGGTHSTKTESYLRIKQDTATNSWTVTGRDGTRTVFSPTLQVASGTLRWGQTSVIDTKNNTVTYTWIGPGDGDWYPSTVSYNGYSVTFYRETRPEVLSFAAYNTVNQTQYRLRSIFVQLGSTPIRAYKLQYVTSPVTGRSLLTSVTQFGKDVTQDGSGAITSGTSLPPLGFTYQNDTLGQTFQAGTPNPPTPPNTTEPVIWANRINVNIAGTGNSLSKPGGNAAWDSGATSTRAIASGDGYMEFTADGTSTLKMAGLSNGNTDASNTDIDFAIYEFYGTQVYVSENGTLYGPWPAANGDKLRVDVQAGVVRYKRNGVPFYTSTRTPTYPLLVDTSLFSVSTINDVYISGALEQAAFWCDGRLFMSGDFNGDGRTDQLCHFGLNTGGWQVALGTSTGFAAPTQWLNAGAGQPVVGDFNSDGKADLADYGNWTGDFSVALSTGNSFSAFTFWGTSFGYYGGFPYHCRLSPATVGTGDFNGDGYTDVSCKINGGEEVFIGLSAGTAFNFSIWLQGSCDDYERTGALDANGDGRDDWYCIGQQTGFAYINYSTGSSFAYPYQPFAPFWCSDPYYVLGDFNSDGRTDFACLIDGKVALSTGNVHVTQGTYGQFCYGQSDWFAADVDGDGASEIVCNNGGAGATDIQVRKWQNNALGPAQTWKASWCAGSMTAGDFNGDSKTDLLCKSLATPVAYAGTGGFQSDLMASVATSLGGTVQAAYTTSVNFQNTNNPPPKYAITSLTTTDGRGGSYNKTYNYSGGLMDRQARQFMGFRTVRETLPCLPGESACPYTETWLKQDLPSAGKPEQVQRADGSGRLIAASMNEYTTNGATVPRTSLLTGQWSYTYDGSGASCPSWPCTAGKRTYTTHQYDAYGNRTQTASYGEYDVAGDEITAAWTLYPNTTAYIVDRVAIEKRHAGIGTGGTKLTETQTFYDLSATLTQPPNQGYPTNVSNWLNPGNRFVSTTLGYDGWGNQTSVTDPTNRTTATTYDSTYHVFPVTVTNNANESETTTWDTVCGIPSQHTDANNQSSTMQSDALCRLTQTNIPLGGFEARSYLNIGNPNTQLVRVETNSPDGSGNNFAEEYFDGLGRTYRTSRKGSILGQTIEADTTHNARGAVATQTAPYYSGGLTQTATNTYDAFDRLTAVTFPDNNDVTKSYGLWSETTYDEHNHDKTSRFNAYGRQIVFEEKLSGLPVQTQYSYDLLGRLTGITDAVSNAWSWTFDSLGRNLAKNDPDAGNWTFTYDDAGRVWTQTDAKGQQTTLLYDAAGRLSTRTTPQQTVTHSYSQPRTGYFNVGRLTTVSSPTSTLTLDYDARGQMLQQVRTLDGTNYTVQRRYNAGGSLTGITYPDGDAVGTIASPITYDGAGRLKTIPGIVNQVLYDAEGRPTSRTNANASVTTHSYSSTRGFLTGINTVKGETTIQNLGYAPDAAGMVSQVTSPFANEGWSYLYDDLHRMTSATSLSVPANNQTFQYDSIGRIMNNSRIGAYTYPPPGSPRPHAPSDIAGGAMNYDLNGSLMTGRGRTITWNADNLPSQVGTTQFTYDGLGARLKKVSEGSTTRYPVGDDYEIRNGSITKYVTVDGLGVVAKRVGTSPSINTFWLHTDRLGSIQAVTNSSGAIALRRTYRPYGEKISDSTSHVESRGWIDERTDETGLTYLHARYYDPALGVFLSPDPAQADASSYGYGYGNPISFVDHTGLFGDDEPFQPDPGDPGFDKIEFVGNAPGNTNGIYKVVGGGVGGGLPFFWDSIFGGGGKGKGGGQTPPGRPVPTPTPAPTPGEPAPLPTPPPDDPAGPRRPRGGPVGAPGPGGAGAPTGGPAPDLLCKDQLDCNRMFIQWIETFQAVVPLGAAGPVRGAVSAARFAKVPLASRKTFLYSLWQKLDNGEPGEFLKWGISWRPWRRYTQSFMRDKILVIESNAPTRAPILNIERGLTEVAPGRLNREPWAGRRLRELDPDQ